MVVEAMGLEISDRLRAALDGVALTSEGLVATAGVGSYATAVPGVFVAGALINGGAAVAQCVAEGMAAVAQVEGFLLEQADR